MDEEAIGRPDENCTVIRIVAGDPFDVEKAFFSGSISCDELPAARPIAYRVASVAQGLVQGADAGSGLPKSEDVACIA